MSPTNVSKYISVGADVVVVVGVSVGVTVGVTVGVNVGVAVGVTVVVVGTSVGVTVGVTVGVNVVVGVAVGVNVGVTVGVKVVVVVDGGATLTNSILPQPLAKFSRYILLTSSDTVTFTPNNNDALLALLGEAATRLLSLIVS
jgi:hypothetical protein